MGRVSIESRFIDSYFAFSDSQSISAFKVSENSRSSFSHSKNEKGSAVQNSVNSSAFFKSDINFCGGMVGYITACACTGYSYNIRYARSICRRLYCSLDLCKALCPHIFCRLGRLGFFKVSTFNNVVLDEFRSSYTAVLFSAYNTEKKFARFRQSFPRNVTSVVGVNYAVISFAFVHKEHGSF